MLILQPCSCEQHQDGATRVPASEPRRVGWGGDWGEVLTPQHTIKVWAGLAYSPETWSVCLPKHAWNLKNHNVDYHLWKLTFHTDRNRMQWWRLESILGHWGYSEGQRLPEWRPFARSFCPDAHPTYGQKEEKQNFPRAESGGIFSIPRQWGQAHLRAFRTPFSLPAALLGSVFRVLVLAPHPEDGGKEGLQMRLLGQDSTPEHPRSQLSSCQQSKTYQWMYPVASKRTASCFTLNRRAMNTYHLTGACSNPAKCDGYYHLHFTDGKLKPRWVKWRA